MSKAATYALSDGPTTERTLKDDYETVGMGKKKRRVKIRTVQTLHESGDIGGEAVTAANRWLEDYIFFKEAYADYLKDPLDRDYIPGNIHTFAVARGKAGARIAEVRDALGSCSHVRLEMLLIEGMSFSAMGKQLWPNKARPDALKNARSQCSLLLEQLANIYVEKHKKEKREKLLVSVEQT